MQSGAGSAIVRRIDPPAGLQESVVAAVLRLSLRLTFRTFVRPPFPIGMQRAVTHVLSTLMPPTGGVEIVQAVIDTPWGPLPAERIKPRGSKPARAILFLHGGAFCVGSPRTHRSITTRLARLTGAEVLVPHYRRTPEHPFPAQIEDSVSAYRQLLADGYDAKQIAVVGDSAGGTLTASLPMAAAHYGLPLPASLVMMSPAVNLNFDSPSMTERVAREPMLHPSLGHQAMTWYAAQPGHPLADPLAQDFSVLPPSLLQVGEDEILYDDSPLFARHASNAGAHVELELCQKRWHVFHIHAGLLPGATAALQRQAAFMLQHWAR